MDKWIAFAHQDKTESNHKIISSYNLVIWEKNSEFIHEKLKSAIFIKENQFTLSSLVSSIQRNQFHDKIDKSIDQMVSFFPQQILPTELNWLHDTLSYQIYFAIWSELAKKTLVSKYQWHRACFLAKY